MVNTVNPSLEKREHALDCVRVNRWHTHFFAGVFASTVIHCVMRVELPFQVVIGSEVVSHDRAGRVRVLPEDRLKILRRYTFHVKRPNITVAFHQRENFLLMAVVSGPSLSTLIPTLPAHIRFVGFDYTEHLLLE